jgi:hypothetical protein
MRSATIHRILCTAGLAASVAACSDSGGAAPSGDTQLAFNLATRAVPSAPASLIGLVAPESYTDDAGNTLTYDRVQIVFREVELENESHDGGCENPAGDDGCEEVNIGPFLVDLPLGEPGASRVFTATVPAGTYDKVEFQIRQPDDDPEDQAFLAEHPEFANISLRVEGSYNGTPFEFTSALEADLELELTTPIVLGGSAETDLTLLVNLDAWFRAPDGTLLDPASADAGVVAENIQRSFEAFEDEDHSGSDDHGPDDGPDDGGPDDAGPSESNAF